MKPAAFRNGAGLFFMKKLFSWLRHKDNENGRISQPARLQT